MTIGQWPHHFPKWCMTNEKLNLTKINPFQNDFKSLDLCGFSHFSVEWPLTTTKSPFHPFYHLTFGDPLTDIWPHIKPIMFTDLCSAAKWFGINTLVSAYNVDRSSNSGNNLNIYKGFNLKFYLICTLPTAGIHSHMARVTFGCGFKLFCSMPISMALNTNRSATVCAFEGGEKWIYLFEGMNANQCTCYVSNGT